MKKKKYSIVLLSSLLLIANSSAYIYANETESKIKISNLETNKDKYIDLKFKNEYKYIELNSILEISDIDFSVNEKKIEFEMNDVKYIVEENKSTFIRVEEGKEIIYPMTIEKIHLLKEYYVPSNNKNSFKINDKFFVPIDFLENKYALDLEKIENDNTVELKKKKKITYNYNYVDSFDDVDFTDIEADRTAKYSIFDETYNKLEVGTKVKPSPVTGFSTVKPKYGFGSDTWTYIPSKGNAKEDNWVGGKITSPYTTDKEKQKEIFQLELGLIRGEYIQVDELGSALFLDFTTKENGVIISFMNYEMSKNFNESYRVHVILSEILAYYINDKELVDKITTEYSYYESDKNLVNELKINEKLSIVQRNGMIDVHITY